ncbi:MAG TPA: hypothetical protein VMD29_06610 [Terracidiphilus sp.]|nr:hypothetical protein [Terracidiphilus sp.]
MIPRYLVIPAVAALAFSASTLANASSAHTWVAYWGSDTNSGTMTSPYADFQTAVANTSAGGIISALTPGDYGAFTITQSITVEGADGAGLTFTGSEGIYIYAPTSASVVLRNLTVNGVGTGEDAIFFEQGQNLVVDHCHLEGFTDIGVGVGSLDPMNVVIRDTVIQGGELGVRTFQSSGGVYNDHVSLQNVTIEGASSAGIFTRNGNMEVVHSVISSTKLALEADTSATLNISSSAIFNNSVAICAYNPGTIRINDNDIYGNATANENCGGAIVSTGNNRLAGYTTNTAPNGKVVVQ